MPDYINRFDGEYAFLSNFYPCRVYMGDGVDYPSVEHAFQAMKTEDVDQRLEIAALGTPGQAKRAGRRLKLCQDWELIKIGFMRQALMSKFRDNKELRDKLLATGSAVLVEGNHHGDRYWGVDGYGENALGYLLMRLRETLDQGWDEPEE